MRFEIIACVNAVAIHTEGKFHGHGFGLQLKDLAGHN